MNRQIKFRIWDKSRKSFLENGSSLHCYSHWMMDVFTGKLYDAIGAIDGDHVDPNHRSLHEDDGYYLEKGKIIKESPYVIQQFTGFATKDGTEIYEGDIVQFEYRVGDLAWEHMEEKEQAAQDKINGKKFIGLVARMPHEYINMEIKCPFLGLVSDYKNWPASRVINWIETESPTMSFSLTNLTFCNKILGHEYQ
jgi:hypothetical protein